MRDLAGILLSFLACFGLSLLIAFSGSAPLQNIEWSLLGIAILVALRRLLVPRQPDGS